MHEQQSQADTDPAERAAALDRLRERAERGPQPPVQIYVADLAAYNDGRLHGTWIDANQHPADLQEAITGMLAGSPLPGAEEWAIHDHEGFAGIHLDENERLETVSRLAEGLAAHGPAFGALAGWLGSEQASSESFEGYYRGSWPRVEDYAEELLRDLGLYDLVEQLPDWAAPYVQVDVAGFARDLQLGGDIYLATDVSGDGQQVHVFDSHP